MRDRMTLTGSHRFSFNTFSISSHLPAFTHPFITICFFQILYVPHFPFQSQKAQALSTFPSLLHPSALEDPSPHAQPPSSIMYHFASSLSPKASHRQSFYTNTAAEISPLMRFQILLSPYTKKTLCRNAHKPSLCTEYMKGCTNQKNIYCIILPVTAFLEKHIKNTVIIEQRPGLQRQTWHVQIKNKSPKANNNNKKNYQQV